LASSEDFATRSPSLQGFTIMSPGNPGSNPSIKAEDFLDMRFVAEMERDGFFKKLAAK
jgi:hypothetical protein